MVDQDFSRDSFGSSLELPLLYPAFWAIDVLEHKFRGKTIMDEVHSFHSTSRNIPEGEKSGGNIPGRSVSPKDPLLKSQ